MHTFTYDPRAGAHRSALMYTIYVYKTQIYIIVHVYKMPYNMLEVQCPAGTYLTNYSGGNESKACTKVRKLHVVN